MQPFITDILRRAGVYVQSSYNDTLHDYEEWRWLVIEYVWYALKRYDGERGVQPMTFLYKSTMGYVWKELRDHRRPGGVRVMRGDAGTPTVQSLDEPRGREENLSLYESIPDRDDYPDSEFVLDITELLATLRKHHRTIILGYLAGMTQQEIAGRIGVSQVQVSRVVRRFGERWQQSRHYRPT